MTDSWRPWRLFSYAEGTFGKKTPPQEPVAGAELSADGAWATLYADDQHTIRAVWFRARKPDRRELDDETTARRARERARLDADRPTV